MANQEDETSIWLSIAIAGIVLTFLLWLLNKAGKIKENSSGSGAKIKSNRLLQLYNARHINAIVDHFKSLDEVAQAIKNAGLESCNLIFGVDFTASNASQGDITFGGKSLHSIDPDIPNPYQQVIKIIGQSLESFDEDGLIPAYGFGDLYTKDQWVFPLKTEVYCQGFQDILEAYNRRVSGVKMSGPTSFAPIIHQAIDIVKTTRQYHILIIVADGQVTSEGPTIEAIVEASKYPLSILLVGVGDGPWQMMQDFDDKLPSRTFDNFQFVDFNQVLSYGTNKDTVFALHALMEIPDQFTAIRKLGLLDF